MYLADILSHTLLVLFLYSISGYLSCYSGGSDGLDESTVNQTIKTKDSWKEKKMWGGWNPPPGAEESWNTWMEKYRQQNAMKGGSHDPNSPGKPAGHNVPGWPSDWSGLGEPFEGMGPPPWSYTPRKYGKPLLCYEPPTFGGCFQVLVRYGFNPTLDNCMAYDYSGCGGSRNKFMTLALCQDTCMHVVASRCSLDKPMNQDELAHNDQVF